MSVQRWGSRFMISVSRATLGKAGRARSGVEQRMFTHMEQIVGRTLVDSTICLFRGAPRSGGPALWKLRSGQLLLTMCPFWRSFVPSNDDLRQSAFLVDLRLRWLSAYSRRCID
mmetsp:Transcript_33072/g.85206  ORF Transcript_33072/g.85206 Transcript_33072/m.85206 type:complete len:114 (+) Transcript_33072:709-1050(+)